MPGDIKLYQPSSGTEGECFMAEWCENCIKDAQDPDAKTKCPIILKSMMYSTEDPEYPNQWRYENGRPICTAFKSREEHNAERRKAPKGKQDKKTIDLFQ